MHAYSALVEVKTSREHSLTAPHHASTIKKTRHQSAQSDRGNWRNPIVWWHFVFFLMLRCLLWLLVKLKDNFRSSQNNIRDSLISSQFRWVCLFENIPLEKATTPRTINKRQKTRLELRCKRKKFGDFSSLKFSLLFFFLLLLLLSEGKTGSKRG